jgi:transglutaminase-like putative cysteine protease
MPKLSTLFRFSTYLSLTLATLAIGISESSQIEGAAAFYLLVGLAILTAYLCEDRWLIPKSIANVLALLILAGWALWVRFSMSGAAAVEDTSSDLLRLMLPRAGPLLAVLMLVKLFRPKTPADYWSLHGLGIMQVVLGCVLALSSRLDRENLLFAGVLGVYMLSFIWAMVTFYIYRENLAAQQARTTGRSLAGTEKPITRVRIDNRTPSPWRSLGLASTVIWFVTAFVLAMALFFMMPRPGQDAGAAFLLRGQVQAMTGFSPGMDLNNVGPLQVNEELVMRVEARDVQDRAVNLGGEARFRGVTCSEYNEGRWRPRRFNDMRQILYSSPPANESNTLQLTYHIDMTKLRGSGLSPGEFQDQYTAVFLAEPIYTPRGQPPVSVEMARADHRQNFNYREVEPALFAPNLRRSRALRYTQVNVLAAPGQERWAQRIGTQRFSSTTLREHDRFLGRLPDRLIASGRLARETQRILTEARIATNASIEQKAKALEAYLAHSGQFDYSLEWVRSDLALDPTEDFLLNVKKGHCELFASALALMLRSQGIQSRVVIGFRGAEWNSITEQMEVRQYHAHAWVEVLLGIRDTDSTFTYQDWTWLTLDPTPAGGTAGAVGADGLRGAWDDEIHFLQFLWESFILDYSGEGERERLLARLSRLDWLRSSWQFWSNLASINKALTILLGGLLLLLLVWAVSRFRRKSQRKQQGQITVAFYVRLLKLLERLGLQPRRAQTPAEFGQEAAVALAKRPPAVEFAALPQRIIDLFYAVRFGGRTLPPEDLQRVDADLDRLARALRA